MRCKQATLCVSMCTLTIYPSISYYKRKHLVTFGKYLKKIKLIFNSNPVVSRVCLSVSEPVFFILFSEMIK